MKTIIIGDTKSQKSSLISYIINNDSTYRFKDTCKATIGFDMINVCARINDITFKLQIWDTCGLEEFNSCTPNLYKDSSLAIIFFIQQVIENLLKIL